MLLTLVFFSAHKPAPGLASDSGPAVLASVLAGADVLSTAMPPSKPTTSWLGGFALKKKVAK